MSVLVLLDEIASALERESDRVRIHKLIFCACKNRWENDKDILLNSNLSDLLLELYQNNTTVEKLTESLYKIVQQLNRKTEYSTIANTIIAQLSQLYEDTGDEMTRFATASDEATQFISFSSSPSPLIEVTRRLEHHEEALRIRKLLFCIDCGQWENNPQKLLNLNLQTLLAKIQQKYANLNDLALDLERIVNSLNRKQEYAQISNLIVNCLIPLYPDSDRVASLSIQNATQNALTSDNDEITIGTHYANRNLEEASAFAEDNSAFATPAAYVTGQEWNGNSLSNESSVATIASQPAIVPQKQGNDTTHYTPAPDTDFNPASEAAELPKTAKVSTMRDYDAFDVRLEVMKYSNPLRAKILAFSTLHHKFEITGKEWSSLRTLSFDELLQNLYASYPNLQALEKPLYETAGSLAEPDESTQAAEAIVKAIKPYYP
ncbi:MAG: hypothetical protein J7647_02760 [Cyanobacteria bacterium SBLK]|nr:hypothetical protein [Cyanobacteria bacterium SBLK]